MEEVVVFPPIDRNGTNDTNESVDIGVKRLGMRTCQSLKTPMQSSTRKKRRRIYPIVKRIAEIPLAFVLFILLSPLSLLIAIAIRLESLGSALFRQKRVGRDRRAFILYKFRSMYQDIDPSLHKTYMQDYISGQTAKAAIHKPIKPSQITRMGRLLRKTSLDELPQLLNIIKGDMSFIGPRPNIPAEVDVYQEWHNRRLEVMPGITGWAQIHGRSSIPFDQIVKYDIEYVEHYGLKMDLKVVFLTIPAVILGHGAK